MSATVKPITPDEVVGAKAVSLPPAVIEAFNELIAEGWSGGSSVVKQDQVISRILQKMPTLERTQIFPRHYLDIEDVYRAAGWSVLYDKPGYNESYAATWRFKKA